MAKPRTAAVVELVEVSAIGANGRRVVERVALTSEAAQRFATACRARTEAEAARAAHVDAEAEHERARDAVGAAEAHYRDAVATAPSAAAIEDARRAVEAARAHRLACEVFAADKRGLLVRLLAEAERWEQHVARLLRDLADLRAERTRFARGVRVRVRDELERRGRWSMDGDRLVAQDRATATAMRDLTGIEEPPSDPESWTRLAELAAEPPSGWAREW